MSTVTPSRTAEFPPVDPAAERAFLGRRFAGLLAHSQEQDRYICGLRELTEKQAQELAGLRGTVAPEDVAVTDAAPAEAVAASMVTLTDTAFLPPGWPGSDVRQNYILLRRMGDEPLRVSEALAGWLAEESASVSGILVGRDTADAGFMDEIRRASPAPLILVWARNAGFLRGLRLPPAGMAGVFARADLTVTSQRLMKGRVRSRVPGARVSRVPFGHPVFDLFRTAPAPG